MSLSAQVNKDTDEASRLTRGYRLVLIFLSKRHRGGPCHRNIASLTAVKLDVQLRAYYQRKVAEGKSKMSVLNAVKANRTADAAHTSGSCR